MDEVGTPFCITVYHYSIEDDSVTIRYRDSAKQDRIKINEIKNILKEKIMN